MPFPNFPISSLEGELIKLTWTFWEFGDQLLWMEALVRLLAACKEVSCWTYSGQSFCGYFRFLKKNQKECSFEIHWNCFHVFTEIFTENFSANRPTNLSEIQKSLYTKNSPYSPIKEAPNLVQTEFRELKIILGEWLFGDSPLNVHHHRWKPLCKAFPLPWTGFSGLLLIRTSLNLKILKSSSQ